jgi:hypothetical protein
VSLSPEPKLSCNCSEEYHIVSRNLNPLSFRRSRFCSETAEASVAATREIGLEVSFDKTKYMAMSRDQNAGRIHSVRIDNSTFERVGEFIYLGTTLTNRNSIAEEIKSRLRSGNACYHSVQNILSSRLLSKHLKIKIYIEIQCCLLFCVGVKLGR